MTFRSSSIAIARAVEAADPPPEQDEQRRRPGDVADARRERDPPRADVVERAVEHRVQEEVRRARRRRDPVRLQAEEGAVQHQHRAVEDEPGAERGERAGDDRCLRRRGSGRAGRGCARSARRARRSPTAAGMSKNAICRSPLLTVAAEPVHVAARREPRQRREEHGRDRDREHPLREHVDEERLLDRRRRERSG